MTEKANGPELHDVRLELASSRLQLAVSRAARDAAEQARDQAETARDAAERFGEAARREIESLREHIAFFKEQAWSTRIYQREVIEPTMEDLMAARAALQAECAALRPLPPASREESPEPRRPMLRLLDSEDHSWVEATRGMRQR